MHGPHDSTDQQHTYENITFHKKAYPLYCDELGNVTVAPTYQHDHLRRGEPLSPSAADPESPMLH